MGLAASCNKVYPSGHQSHANCTQVAASRMQIPVILFLLHATGGHSGTICMQLLATWVHFACNCWPLRYTLYALATNHIQTLHALLASCLQSKHAARTII